MQTNCGAQRFGMRLEFHQLDRAREHWRAHCPERQKRLLASLAAHGQQTPIVVVTIDGLPDRYRVIDGYQRIAALQQLGRDTVDAMVWPGSELEAVLLEGALRRSRRLTPLEEGWLLEELERRFGQSVAELARRFDRSTDWVARRLALVELLPVEVQAQVRSGQIPPQMAMKFLAPLARISRQDCRRMGEVFARRKWTTRQAGQLYTAWRSASAAVRERILREPELFLKAQREQQGAEGALPAAALLNDLQKILALTQRAQRHIAHGTEIGIQEEQCAQAQRQIERAIEQLNRLASKLPREEQVDVESQSTHHDSGVAAARSGAPPDRAGDEDLARIGTQGGGVEHRSRAGVESSREGRALPPADPGADPSLHGEFGASP